MPWLAVWRDAPPALSQAARLSGAVRNLVLRLHTGVDGKTHYSTTARLDDIALAPDAHRSEEHTSELQSLMRISYAVFCLKKKNTLTTSTNDTDNAASTIKQTP